LVLGAGLDSCGTPGFERRTVLLIASHYTDCTVRWTNGPVDIKLNSLDRFGIDHNIKFIKSSGSEVKCLDTPTAGRPSE